MTGVGTLVAVLFLCWSMSRFGDAEVEFDQRATELAALQSHNPFPSEENLRKMKAQAEEYGTTLAALQEDLKTRVLPLPAAMKPNEFQTRLRQAMTSVAEKARVHNVKLPENFYLGFEEFGAKLPDTEAAAQLGRELAQVELLVTVLIDARVQAVTSLKRVARGELPSVAATPAARTGTMTAAPAPVVERAVIEVAFVGPPGAMRRVLNQISSAGQQLYVIRTLQVVNEKETGPPRGGEGSSPAPVAGSADATSALQFIVGNEQVQTVARIEMVRFAF